MRIRLVVAILLGTSCKAPTPPVPPAANPPPRNPPLLCDDGDKPKGPQGDVGTPDLCRAAKGTWVDHWEKAQGGSVEPGWQVLGRGNRRYRGCAHLPSTDEGKACRYDGECQGSCVPGANGATTCSALIEPDPGVGCRLRCVKGELQRECVD